MRKIVLLFLTISILSCNDEMKFESDKWKPVESGLYGNNYRKRMVFDLVNNVLQSSQSFYNDKAMSISEVRKLIGNPSRKDTINKCLIYKVEEKQEYNIDPTGGMILKLYFDKDSILKNWKVEEFWNQP